MEAEKRGFKLHEFVAHNSDVRCATIGKRSSRVFLTGGDDRRVNLWSFGKQTPLLTLAAQTSGVECVGFDSAEVLVLAGLSNGSIKLWDLEESKMVRALTGHRSACTAVEFHPFGEFFASGSADTDLKIWDIRKKGCIHTYTGHMRPIKKIRFTPDGRWVVTGGEDSIVKLWDLTAGKLMHEFKFHSGPIRCIDFHPQQLLLATGSDDRTVKFWDLETFELIGSAGPEVSGVRSMVFHPDGKTLFCSLDMTLKVFSWEPVRCHDDVDIKWTNLADLSIYEGKLLGCSFHESQVGVWLADISLIRPYALGVLPKENYLMKSMQDHIEDLKKPLENAIKCSPLPVTGNASSGQLKEPGTASQCTSRVTTTSSDRFKQGSVSPVATRRFEQKILPKMSAKNNSSPFNGMKSSVNVPAKPAESHSGLRGVPASSSTVATNNLVPIKKGNPLDLVSVKDIQAIPPISVPVVVPRDASHFRIAADGKTTKSTFPDTFKNFAHSRKDTLSSDTVDTESQLTFKFDNQISLSKPSPADGKAGFEPIGNYEQAEANEHVLMEQPVQSINGCDAPCSTPEPERVKYVRGVAVPLGKTRSIVESWEKRERSGHNSPASSFTDQVEILPQKEKNKYACSSESVSCADDVLRTNSLLSSLGSGDSASAGLTLPGQAFEKDLTTVTEDLTPIILVENHDEFINVVKSRLTKLEVVCHFFSQSGISGAITAVTKLPDSAVQADVVSSLKSRLDLFNLECFSSLLPVLVSLLNSKTTRHAVVSIEILLDLLKIFGPVINSTLSAKSLPKVDIQAEQRLQRCTRCFNNLQKIQRELHPLIVRGDEAAKLAQQLNLSLQDLVVF